MKKRIVLSIALIFMLILFIKAQQKQKGIPISTFKNLFPNHFNKNNQNIQKDNPQARIDFDILRTKDPKTGKIPKNIRAKELAFMKAQAAKQGIPFAIGDRLTNWVNRGPHNVGGRTRALAIDHDDSNIILAGGVSGGMWRSNDKGLSWTKTTGSNELQSVSCLIQDTTSTENSTWYYGTGEIRGNSASGTNAPYRGNGIYKSIDNGLTWTILPATATNIPELFDSHFDYNYEIVINPTNGNILIANYGGIYQSTDGGSSFTQVLARGEASNGSWTDIVMSSIGMAYASIDDQGIFSSANGINWTMINPTSSNFTIGERERKELALAPSNENILYFIGQSSTHTSGHTLQRFDESTDTWTDLSDNIPRLGGSIGNFDSQGGYDLLVKVKPNDENFVLIGGTNLYRSTDGFSTTTNTRWIGGYENNEIALYPNHHPDQHSFVFMAGDSALSGNDGGVQLTSDITANLAGNAPVTWISLNNGYLTSQVYALSFGPGNQIMAGFQDNSTWLTIDTLSDATWTDQFGGDGAYNAFNSDGTIRYLSSQLGNIFRLSYDNANDIVSNTFTPFTPSTYSTSLFIVPFYLDPINDDLFYLAGSNDFYINTQSSTGSSGVGWKTVSLPGINASDYISEIGVSRSNVVYAGTTRGRLYKIVNPGGEAITTGITGENFPLNAYISGVSVNQLNSDEILVCFSNYSIPSIFYSSDGGTSWTDVSGNLEENIDGSGSGPSLRSCRIIGDGDRYFVGTSAGLYSTNSLVTPVVWTQEDPNGIGDVVVEHVIERMQGGLVGVGTHGNGAYTARFEVSGLSDTDLAVTEISSPITGPLTETETITTTIFNNGTQAQTGFTLSLNIDGIDLITETINTSLPANQALEHTFSTTYDFSEVTNYTITVTLTHTGDIFVDNNSFSTVVAHVPALIFDTIRSFPYIESFESNNHGGWINLDSVWELGEPNQTNLNSASEGSRAWMTDLDANYPNNTFSFLITPIFDFSNLPTPHISFDINYDLEDDYDVLYLAYSINGGGFNDIIPFEAGLENWYNLDSFAWSGSSGGNYMRSVANLNFLAEQSNVQFAFILFSDASVNQEGIALDAFKILAGINQAPSDIILSNNTIAQGHAIGTLIGVLSTIDANNPNDTHSYNLSGLDAASFRLQNNELLSAEVFNFAIKNTYQITITTTDACNLSYSENFTITVNPNQAPSDIILSNNTIAQGHAIGTLIGVLSTIDANNPNDTHSYNLSGLDAASFRLQNNELLSAEVFNFAIKNTYQITITTIDESEASYSKNFTITVNPNQAPSDIILSNNTIAQGHAIGTLIGVLSTIDANNPNDTHSYNLSGLDAASFRLQNNELLSAEVFNFAIKNTYQITITTIDESEASYSKNFTINIGNITSIADNPLSQNNILLYPNPAANSLKISGLKNLKDVKIYFINSTGQVVKTYNTPQSEYDISGLPNGTYIAVILKDNKRKMITFIIN